MDTKRFLREAAPTALALAVMLLACVAYFLPQLRGEQVPSGDTISFLGASQELRAYEAETGDRALWTNSMFGGMPAYQIYATPRGNLLRYVERVAHLGIERPIGYFFALMAGLFLLLRVLGVQLWLAALGAVAFGLGTNHMTLFEAGHMTKIRAIAFMAPTLAGLVVLFRGRYLAGLALFAVSLGVNVYANHPQMTYYLAAAAGCFVVFRLIRDWQSGELPRFGRALGLAFLGAGLAVAASYGRLASTVEYGRDTMRGAPILSVASEAEATSSSQVEGLEWGYAMQWSNGLIDVMAGFVPGIAGGSGQVEVEPDGPLATAIRRGGGRLPAGFKAPLYHGELPFTSGPVYFGAVLVYLFVLGLFFLRPGWRYFFGAAVLLTLLISMGKHAAWLNRPLFDLVPYFNSFRAPSSATSVTAMLVAAGGLAGLCRLLKSPRGGDTPVMRKFYLGTGATLGLLLLVLALGGSLIDFASDGDARLAEAGFPLDAVVAERMGYLRRSAVYALLFVAQAAFGLWIYLRGQRVSVLAVSVFIGFLAVSDVWRVSRDYLDADSFEPARQATAALNPRPVDEQILADPDPHYRVLDLSVNTFNSSVPSYFHKTVGGYHAAKLQRIQDLIDRHIVRGNQAVLDMLNTRYVIAGQAGQEQVQRNPGALGNAWFVRDVRVVASADAEIDALAELDPARTAVVHGEFAARLPARSFSGSGTIELTDYAPDALTYASRSDAPQLAVFSEMWYGPDKGWTVTVDGEPAELIRANYALRALPLPAGAHTIEMRFEPESFYRGETVSYVASGLLLALAAAAFYFAWRRRREQQVTSVA